MTHTEDWEFEEHRVRIYRAGEGPPVLLLHGIGPGTSIPANFGAVIPALAERHTVYGMDLIGFGGSSGKAEAPYFDFALWRRQASFVARRIAGPDLRVWGQSMGGALALALAAELGAVTKLVTTGAGGGLHRLNASLDRFWSLPSSRDALRAAMVDSVYDRAEITDALVAQRYDTLRQGEVGSYFARMMDADKQAMLDSAFLAPAILGSVGADALLIHGREDRPVPYEETAAYYARFVPRADLVLLGRCGHNPAREHAAKVTALVLAHFA
jgi:2-hydroxymuconate-semialdehyde hydrolase